MPTRGQITFVFDDGYQTVFDQVVPLLNQHQFPGVFAIPLNDQAVTSTERIATAPLAKWQSLAANGHEIAAHSVNHKDLAKQSDQALNQELAEPARTLGASTLVYPGGAHDDRVVAATSRHYQAARTTLKGFEYIPAADPMRLKTYNFTQRSFSVAKANLLALSAWLQNKWLIETYHLVTDDPTDYTHTVQLADFAKHLDFVSRLPIKVITIKQGTQPHVS